MELKPRPLIYAIAIGAIQITLIEKGTWQEWVDDPNSNVVLIAYAAALASLFIQNKLLRAAVGKFGETTSFMRHTIKGVAIYNRSKDNLFVLALVLVWGWILLTAAGDKLKHGTIFW